MHLRIAPWILKREKKMAEKKTNGVKIDRNHGIKRLLRIDTVIRIFTDWKILSVILAVIFLAISIFLFPPTKQSREIRYRDGDIADADVIAPFSFSVPFTESEIVSNKAKAVMNCPPVYRGEQNMGTRMTGDLIKFYEQLDAVAQNDTITVEDRYDFVKRVIPGIKENLLERLMNKKTRNTFKRESVGLIKTLLENGVINDDSPLRRRNYFNITVISGESEKLRPATSLISQAQLEGLILDKGKAIFGKDSELTAPFYNITRSFLEPNLIFDRDETRLRRNAKIEGIPKSFRISKNQRIISKHDKITKKQIDTLKMLESERARIELDTSIIDKELLFLGKLISIAALLAIFGFALYRFAPGMLTDPGKLTMGFIILIFYLLSVSIILNLCRLVRYLLPSSQGPRQLSA